MYYKCSDGNGNEIDNNCNDGVVITTTTITIILMIST